jgi:polyferredoxin
LIFTSFLLFPIIMNYFSPYLIVEAALVGIMNGSFVVFTLLFMSSLFLGRGFCGWLCPAGGLQEISFVINNNRAGGGRGDWSKYACWTPWFAIIITFVIMAGGFNSVNVLFMMDSVISVDEPSRYFIYYIIILLLFLPSLVMGKRAACHHICWMAPFMIIGSKIRNTVGWPALQLEARTEDCKSCKRCSRNCPMSLDVTGMVQAGSMENMECILCGTCVDECPRDVISYSLRKVALVGFGAVLFIYWLLISWVFRIGWPFGPM